jgi:hypothetical protein
MIPGARGDSAIAYRDIEVTGTINRRSSRGPDPSFAGRGYGKDQHGCLWVGSRHGDHTSTVIATVTVESSIGNIDAPIGQGQSSTLLVSTRIGARRINAAAEFEGSAVGIHSDEQMSRPTHFSYGKDQVGGWIIDRRASDAQGINVSARKGRERYRRSNVGMPDHAAFVQVKGVERVAFGRHDDPPMHNERFGIDSSV